MRQQVRGVGLGVATVQQLQKLGTVTHGVFVGLLCWLRHIVSSIRIIAPSVSCSFQVN